MMCLKVILKRITLVLYCREHLPRWIVNLVFRVFASGRFETMAWSDQCKVSFEVTVRAKEYQGEKKRSINSILKEVAAESGIPVGTLKRWWNESKKERFKNKPNKSKHLPTPTNSESKKIEGDRRGGKRKGAGRKPKNSKKQSGPLPSIECLPGVTENPWFTAARVADELVQFIDKNCTNPGDLPIRRRLDFVSAVNRLHEVAKLLETE